MALCLLIFRLLATIGSIERTKYGKETKCRGNFNGNKDFPSLCRKGVRLIVISTTLCITKMASNGERQASSQVGDPKVEHKGPSHILDKGGRTWVLNEHWDR